MQYTIDALRSTIKDKIPQGSIVPEHTDRGHFYRVLTPDADGIVYPSVTGKLQVIKDEGLINYKMNQAIQYVFKRWKEFTDENVMEHLDLAARASMDVLTDAGDIGTDIHNTRERIFSDWIKTGVMPEDFLSYIHESNPDPRMISAIRALKKFCVETQYQPIATELMVYSHDLRTAGSLDDIGFIFTEVRKGDKECQHERMIDVKRKVRCLKCNYKAKLDLVLLDLKTSNRFKDHYFFQVAIYFDMFRKLTGVTPDRCIILKVSKENGTYSIEDLKRPKAIASYAKALIRMNEGIEFVRSLRKDNQKVVTKMEI